MDHATDLRKDWGTVIKIFSLDSTERGVKGFGVTGRISDYLENSMNLGILIYV